MSRRKPRKLRYPTTRIQRRTAILEVQLRRIFNRFSKREITRDEARKLGEDVLKQAYSDQLGSFNRYITEKGLTEGVNRKEPELSDALKETLDNWNKIVDDMP